jgi:hypothetical protein
MNILKTACVTATLLAGGTYAAPALAQSLGGLLGGGDGGGGLIGDGGLVDLGGGDSGGGGGEVLGVDLGGGSDGGSGLVSVGTNDNGGVEVGLDLPGEADGGGDLLGEDTLIGLDGGEAGDEAPINIGLGDDGTGTGNVLDLNLDGLDPELADVNVGGSDGLDVDADLLGGIGEGEGIGDLLGDDALVGLDEGPAGTEAPINIGLGEGDTDSGNVLDLNLDGLDPELADIGIGSNGVGGLAAIGDLGRSVVVLDEEGADLDLGLEAGDDGDSLQVAQGLLDGVVGDGGLVDIGGGPAGNDAAVNVGVGGGNGNVVDLGLGGGSGSDPAAGVSIGTNDGGGVSVGTDLLGGSGDGGISGDVDLLGGNGSVLDTDVAIGGDGGLDLDLDLGGGDDGAGGNGGNGGAGGNGGDGTIGNNGRIIIGGAGARNSIGALFRGANAPRCSVEQARQVLTIAQQARYTGTVVRGWQQASRIEVVPVRLCSSTKAQVAGALEKAGIGSLQQLVASSSTLSQSLGRYDADDVYAIAKQGNTLNVYVY